MRLGIYADLAYRADNDGVSTDRAFILFIAALAKRVDELVLFGRLDPRPGRAPYVLPERIRFSSLKPESSSRHDTEASPTSAARTRPTMAVNCIRFIRTCTLPAGT